MIAGAMVGWRNPARYIAPLALAAAVTATYLVVHHALIHKHSASTTITQTQTTVARHHGHPPSSKAKFYVVRPGDSLLRIAAKTGVSITTIEELNPKVNPNSLQPSQRLLLRR
jgi:LysM repeat protein